MGGTQEEREGARGEKGDTKSEEIEVMRSVVATTLTKGGVTQHNIRSPQDMHTCSMNISMVTTLTHPGKVLSLQQGQRLGSG